jgi:hypothetical protein
LIGCEVDRLVGPPQGQVVFSLSLAADENVEFGSPLCFPDRCG